MTVICKDIMDFMEEIAPAWLAESWDNVGLLVGNREARIEKILLCLDVTPQVLEEAVALKANMIISHHPFIFKPLNRVQEDGKLGGMIYKLIKNNINLYSAHTNLDTAPDGVNDCLARTLGLENITSLNSYKAEKLYKLVVFVPVDDVEAVREAICKAGAGHIGQYSDCSFATEGIGSFKPLEGTNPYIGSQGNLEKVREARLETVVPQPVLKNVIQAMLSSHPYEEVAYDIYPLELEGRKYGLGNVGTLHKPLLMKTFIEYVKNALGISSLKVIGTVDGEISRVAVFCGSFDGNFSQAIAHKADVLITGDVKYHTAVEALSHGLCVIDAGHFNTERVVLPELSNRLLARFPDTGIIISRMEEEPFKTC